MKFKKKHFLIFIFFIGIATSSKYISKTELVKNLGFLISTEEKKKIKKIIAPYSYISDLEKLLKNRDYRLEVLQPLQSKTNLKNDFTLKNEQKNLLFSKLKIQKLKQIDKDLIIFEPSKNIISTGVRNYFPGSGWIQIYKSNLFLASSIGIIAYGDPYGDNLKLQQIPNNINNFLTPQMLSYKGSGVKDILISDDKIYISFTKELKEECWNTSVIEADLNFQFLTFQEIFSPLECTSENVKDSRFTIDQSGGRIVKFDKKHIILSVGEYRNRSKAQDKKSIFGKLIKINLKNKDFQIISMGHRNQQGLYFDKKENILISSEHGPRDGDEVNISVANDSEIPNFGWPLASYGTHYKPKTKENYSLYKKYPFFNSHKQHGFIEPTINFNPSIGPSEIIGTKNSREYILSSLKGKSIFLINLDQDLVTRSITRVNIGERIRDISYQNGYLFLFLEDSASIGKINFN